MSAQNVMGIHQLDVDTFQSAYQQAIAAFPRATERAPGENSCSSESSLS